MLKGFIGPSGEKIGLDKAPAFFEDAGLIPTEITELIIRSDQGRGPTPYLSPSVLIPPTTCRREVVLQRFFDFHMEPMNLWAAKEGEIWHKAFSSVPCKDYMQEVMLPADPDVEGWKPEHGDDSSHPLVKRCPEDGKLRVEVFPGVWMRGILDRISLNWKVIDDHKTQRWSRKDYSSRNLVEWAVQLNIYRIMVKLLRDVDPEMFIWRTYRGGYVNPDNPIFRKLPVPRVEKERLWGEIETFTNSLLGAVQKAYEHDKSDPEGLETIVRALPMDGEPMFNGQKCGKYCRVMEKCYSIQGLPLF